MKNLLITFFFSLISFVCYSQKQSSIPSSLGFFNQAEIPSDMYGCGDSYFNSIANRKATKFMGIDDGAKYAIFKIDGKLERFIQVNYVGNASRKGWISVYQNKNKSIRLTIEVKSQKSVGDEDSFITGFITLENKGKKDIISFVGDSGC